MGGYSGIIWFLVIGALLYFMLKGGGCCGGGGKKHGKDPDSGKDHKDKAPDDKEGQDSGKEKGCH